MVLMAHTCAQQSFVAMKPDKGGRGTVTLPFLEAPCSSVGHIEYPHLEDITNVTCIAVKYITRSLSELSLSIFGTVLIMRCPGSSLAFGTMSTVLISGSVHAEEFTV